MNLSKYKHLVLSLAIGGLTLAGLFLWLNSTPPPVHALPDTRYVARSGNDSSNDCLSNDTPCATIQRAIDQANTGDEIRVAQGTYTDLHVTGGMTAVVQLNKALTIRGGYTTTDWSTSYPLTQPVVIDAQGQGRGVIIAAGITATLEGLQITNGRGDPWGGGILASTGARATISGCWIYNNRAERYSGGIHIYSGTLTLTNNYIYSNTAGRDGGGVNLSHSSGTLMGNHIYGNTVISYNGGGVYLGYATDVVLQDNHIYSNTATYYGGGVYLWTSGDVVLMNNRICDNEVTQHYGSGVYLTHSGDVALRGNHIYGNAAPYHGGGIYINDSSNVTMTNNLLVGNRLTAASGGAAAIYLKSSDSHLLHTTIARNTGGQGWGIYVGGSTLWMTNTILVSHTVGISVTAGSTATLEGTLWGSGSWANGTDWGGEGSIITGTVNLWSDPAFVDPDGGDYHLGSASAAIDAGVEAGVTEDIDGDTRPVGAAPDTGADEFGTRLYLPLVLKNHP